MLLAHPDYKFEHENWETRNGFADFSKKWVFCSTEICRLDTDNCIQTFLRINARIFSSVGSAFLMSARNSDALNFDVLTLVLYINNVQILVGYPSNRFLFFNTMGLVQDLKST